MWKQSVVNVQTHWQYILTVNIKSSILYCSKYSQLFKWQLPFLFHVVVNTGLVPLLRHCGIRQSMSVSGFIKESYKYEWFRIMMFFCFTHKVWVQLFVGHDLCGCLGVCVFLVTGCRGLNCGGIWVLLCQGIKVLVS